MFEYSYKKRSYAGPAGVTIRKHHVFPVLQTKLTVNEPNDKYEQEADSIADKIVNMKEDDTLRRKPLSSSVTPLVQTKRESGRGISPSLGNRISAARGRGNDMDAATRNLMSARFGADFSKVKIHADQEAASMNRELSARAFTIGNDIYFNAGEYETLTGRGRLLLAHELTHTLQQQNTGMLMRQGEKEKKKENKPEIDYHLLPPDFKFRLNHLVFKADTSAVELDYTTKSLRSKLSYEYGGALSLSLGGRGTTGSFSWLPGQNDLKFRLSHKNFGLGFSATPGAGKYAASLHLGQSLLPMPDAMSSTFMAGGTAGGSMLTGLPQGLSSPYAYYQQHKSDIEDITKSIELVKKITDAGKKKIRFGADFTLSYDPVHKTVFTARVGAQLLF